MPLSTPSTASIFTELMVAQQLFVNYYAKFRENRTYCLAFNIRLWTIDVVST